MNNLEKAFLVLGAILLVIGISLMIEGQILGDRTIPAAIVSTIVGISFLLSGTKTKKS
jgi:predicted tellurium resistance membrane protein TerC